MDSRRFDLIGKWLATRENRRTTLRGLTAGAVTIGLGRLTLEEAAAKCTKDGGKCKKNNECCSKLCKGGTCKCRSLQNPCSGTVGSAGNTCCGSLLCASTTCSTGKRCCKGLGNSCQSNCDCCLTGAQCQSGECCLGEGAICAFLGSEACCTGLFCDINSGITCQPIKIKLP